MKGKYSLKIAGLDISKKELSKNKINNEKIIYDATNPNYKNDLIKYSGKFDLAVSKMFLEHVKDPEITHKLIAYCLKPGGKVIHFHPTLYDSVFLLNMLLPRKIGKKIAEYQFSVRKTEGIFPAYYKKCRAIDNNLKDFFKSLDFSLINEYHYYGSEYFECIFPVYLFLFPAILLCCYLDLKIFCLGN